MKILYVLGLILLLVGSVVGELIVKDPGYVMLSYQSTTVETSIWGLAIIVTAAFIVFHLGLKFLQYVLERRRKIRDWNENRTRVRANRRTLRGLLALSSGDWQKSQNLLVSAADKAELPLINYLAAARAAHEQGLPDASDRYLQQAQKEMPNAETAIGITRAQIQFSRGQLEPCLATLKRLRGISPRHTYVLRMMKQVYVQQQDWTSLAELIPYLQKNDVFRGEQLRELEQKAYAGQMEEILAKLPAETDGATRLKTLNKTWKALPRELADDPKLVASYVSLLAENNATDKAESYLRDSIRREWDDELIKLYGLIAGSDASKQLQNAKEWEMEHGGNANLLLTLGRLSMLNSQWEQARDYFEKSMEINKSQETYNELARLLQHMDDSEGFQKLMEENLDSVTKGLPQLPLPAANP